MLREIKKKTAVYGILAVLSATILGAVCLNFGIRPLLPPVSVSALNTFSSNEELENYLRTNQKTPYYFLEVSELPRMLLPLGVTPSTEYLAGVLEGVDVNTIVPESGPEYSVTNVQVAGVDEADLVKTDGEYMYVVSGNNVTILKAYPAEDAEILSQISLNGTLRGIFVNEDKLAVFGESYYYQPVEAYYVENVTVRIDETTPLPPSELYISSYRLYSTSRETFVKVYDVSDRANPFLTRDVTINGTYFSSRMIGDYVYAVTNQPVLWRDSTVILPIIISLSDTKTIQPNEIYYSNVSVSDNSHAFTTVFAINLKLDESEPVHKTFLLGSASCMYVSLDNMYITMPKQWSSVTSSTEATLIYRVHVRDGEIECEAKGEVPGRVLNQFSMDEYAGYFRIATTISQDWNSQTPSRNNLYVLNMDLNIIGKLEDLAPTETIYSARFMGYRCYLVTFRRVDPFFVIDLHDPYDPIVLGKLKIPGYSSYLHPYDEKHIIGIGKDEERVKISLFDVSNVSAPVETAKYSTGMWSSSLALDDHKAVLFDKSRNLLVMPMTIYENYVWQGAYVFKISIEEIVLRGRITHMENDTDKAGVYYYYSPNHVKRTLYIDNVLYTISDKKVKMNNLETLQGINEIELP